MISILSKRLQQFYKRLPFCGLQSDSLKLIAINALKKIAAGLKNALTGVLQINLSFSMSYYLIDLKLFSFFQTKPEAPCCRS
jgi:hypothetical protein